MSEAKDPAIKLFGKTIPLPEVPVSSGDSQGAGCACSGPAVEDTMGQDLASSTNCSPEINTNTDGEEPEVEKVLDCSFVLILIEEVTYPFYGSIN